MTRQEPITANQGTAQTESQVQAAALRAIAQLSEIKVGDIVRSFDFAEPGKAYGRDLEGENACYVIGVVRGFEWVEGCARYHIEVAARVWKGETRTRGFQHPEIFPPVNGTPRLFGGVCDGVEKV